MSKTFKDTSIINGFIAPMEQPKREATKSTQKALKEPATKKATNTPKKDQKAIKSPNNDNYKYRNGTDKTNNYTITFKIDADIEDYLRNIDKITFIESMKKGKAKSTNATDFVNDLIRADMIKRLGIKTNKPNEWIKQFKDYANKNGLI